MLKIVRHSPYWIENIVLRDMFAARKSVFIDLLRWSIPVVDRHYEMDQFDTGNAVYLVVTDADGRHRASARLLPTICPHLLDTLFAPLCDAPPPRGTDVMEITRFCLDRRLSARERLSARNQLVSAIVDYGLANGISTYTGIAELAWFQQILAFGWHCRALGLPADHDTMRLVALRIDIAAETPALMAAEGIYRPTIEREDMCDAA